MLTLFTTHCPHCKSVEQMLNLKKIEYLTVDDKNKVMETARENNLSSAPFILADDGTFIGYPEVLKWIREQK